MKFLLAALIIALLSFVAGLYLPWWTIAIAAFITILFIPMRSGKAFLAGFSGVFILWALLAYLIDIKNEHILSGKIADLFQLGGSSLILIFVTAFIGGLVGGLGAI